MTRRLGTARVSPDDPQPDPDGIRRRWLPANPFRLKAHPHPDPRVRETLAREYVRREFPMTYSGQSADLLAIVVGIGVRIWWIVAVGVAGFLINGTSRLLMRRFARGLDEGVSLDRLTRNRLVFYVLVGFSWAVVAWPTILLQQMDAMVAVLPVIAIVAMVIVATSSCYVPPFYAAVSVGFHLAMLPFVFVANGVIAIVIVVSLPVLQYLTWDLARSTLRQLTDMLEMQYERDQAIADQAQVIDELDASRIHATRLASTDGVTRLPNRPAFMEHLGQRMTPGAGPLTLILLDLDHFKNVNDTMGHNVGDSVLLAMASALRTLEGDDERDTADTFIARLGGDELAVVVPGALDPLSATRRFETWLGHFAELEVPEVGTLSLSATGGSASFPRDGTTRESLLHGADMALRSAKATCRGTHQAFQPTMNARFNRETSVANHLRHAIDNGDLVAFVQPQVRMSDDAVIGGELLTRFTGPGLDEVPVQTVFDVAEERGLGRRLSDTLLELAGRSIVDLRARLTYRVPLAVNLSPSTLKTPESLRAQLRCWLELGLRPDAVKLEITEDAITGRGLDHVEATLHAIAAMGFTFSLDDFGTGHSSLAHLRRLPIAEIKIAKEFVESVADDPRDQAIVRTALTLCDHLAIASVVEGVESSQQRDALVRMGATIGQGHLWAAPLPVSAFIAFVNARPAPVPAQVGAVTDP